MYPVDLHTHTTRSDGKDTPQELIEHAAEQRIKILAICDHDTLPPKQITVGSCLVDPVAYGEQLGVCVIPGIEISCDTVNEDVHIVGLGCDWNTSWFQKLESGVISSKLDGYRRLLQSLNDYGIPITLSEVLQAAGMEGHPERLQKKMIFETIARKGFTKTWSDAKILVKSTPSLNIKREKPDPLEVISEIHKAKGYAVLAHPFLISEGSVYQGYQLSRKEYIQNLIEAGLDGIEARYTYDKTSYDGQLSKQDIYLEIIKEYTLPIISGGSDYHADYKTGSSKCRCLGEAGLTEQEFWQNPILPTLLHKKCGDV